MKTGYLYLYRITSSGGRVEYIGIKNNGDYEKVYNMAKEWIDKNNYGVILEHEIECVVENIEKHSPAGDELNNVLRKIQDNSKGRSIDGIKYIGLVKYEI